MIEMTPAGTDLLLLKKIISVQPEMAEDAILCLQKPSFCHHETKRLKTQVKPPQNILVCLVNVPTITKCGLCEINPQFYSFNVKKYSGFVLSFSFPDIFTFSFVNYEFIGTKPEFTWLALGNKTTWLRPGLASNLILYYELSGFS